MNGKMKWMVAGVFALMLVTLGIGGTIVFAQSPTTTPQVGKTTWFDLYRQALAQKLGTTVEKLTQAETDARKDAATQAVKQGLMTQAQADAMLQRGASTGRASADVSTAIRNAVLDAAAKTLGMTSADLTTALKTKSLLDLANEKKVDVAKLRAAMADAEKAAIDQAVKDGKLSQAQADAMKANLKPENVDLNRHGWGVAPNNRFAPNNRPGGFTPPGRGFGKR